MLFLSAVFNLYKMAIIRIKKKDNPFVQIDKGLLKDRELSLKAKGLLCCLLAFPDDWKISIADLKNRSKDGERSVTSAINELIQSGYMTREKSREGGRFKGYDYTVFEEKQSTVTTFCRHGESKNGKQQTTNNIGTNNIATTTKAIWSIEDIKNHIRTEYSSDWNSLATMVEQQTFLAIPLEICREGLASFMTKCDAKANITSHEQLEKELAEWIRKEYKFSKLAATKKKSRTIPNGRPNSKTRDIQYIQNAKDTLLRVRGELVGNNTIQALEQKDIFVKNEENYLNKLDHLTNIKLEYFKDNDCISEYFLFDLLYSNTFHYLRKSFRVIGDNVEDHILVKGTINKFKKKLFNELSDYNQSKGDIYKLAYKHHKKTQL